MFQTVDRNVLAYRSPDWLSYTRRSSGLKWLLIALMKQRLCADSLGMSVVLALHCQCRIALHLFDDEEPHQPVFVWQIVHIASLVLSRLSENPKKVTHTAFVYLPASKAESATSSKNRLKKSAVMSM
jgi:hypothetical protein